MIEEEIASPLSGGRAEDALPRASFRRPGSHRCRHERGACGPPIRWSATTAATPITWPRAATSRPCSRSSTARPPAAAAAAAAPCTCSIRGRGRSSEPAHRRRLDPDWRRRRALAFRQQGRDDVAVIYLGDAALEEGVYHESANFAALRGPARRVCLREQPLLRLHPAGSAPAQSAAGRDGPRPWPDLLSCRRQRRARRPAGGRRSRRSGAKTAAGASFILADTYRWREHCGPFYDNDLGYRSEAEFQAWRKRDPVVRHRRLLSEAGLVGPAGRKPRSARDDRGRDRRGLRLRGKRAPAPEPETAGEGVYA